MADDRVRLSLLAGFWSVIVGALALLSLIAALDPITSQQDCPNYGASGNASAFADPIWDLYLPVITVAWIAVVAVEQTLPVTRRHRSRAAWASRAAVAIAVAFVGSCAVVVPLGIVCR